MAKKLNLNVIAEGIETQEQDAFILAEGCECGQGYLYGSRLLPWILPLSSGAGQCSGQRRSGNCLICLLTETSFGRPLRPGDFDATGCWFLALLGELFSH